MPDFRLHGKTAIITGGAGGLGRSMLAAYAEAGANVVVAGRKASDALIGENYPIRTWMKSERFWK